MKKLLILNILFLSFSTFAADYKPYPKAKISHKEWQIYYQEIKENFSNSEKKYLKYNLVTYSDDKTRMNFAFTTEGHPAHPSWITRQVIMSNETLDMQQIGYFAGNEEAFAVLFQQYAKLTEQTRKKFQK